MPPGSLRRSADAPADLSSPRPALRRRRRLRPSKRRLPRPLRRLPPLQNAASHPRARRRLAVGPQVPRAPRLRLGLDEGIPGRQDNLDAPRPPRVPAVPRLPLPHLRRHVRGRRRQPARHRQRTAHLLGGRPRQGRRRPRRLPEEKEGRRGPGRLPREVRRFDGRSGESRRGRLRHLRLDPVAGISSEYEDLSRAEPQAPHRRPGAPQEVPPILPPRLRHQGRHPPRPLPPLLPKVPPRQARKNDGKDKDGVKTT
mmetsp:Transcript_10790/g.35759  ORF Transcript_10790/g.35759 Transcript_10790/m.35759 type:complete len:255 (+) Transcript_10790:847-1611(+)